MEAIEYFAFGIDAGPIYFMVAAWVAAPIALIAVGQYWAVRKQGSKNSRKVRLLGLATLIAGFVLMFLVLNNSTREFAFLALGPIALAAGVTHMVLSKNITNSGIVIAGIGLAATLIFYLA